MREGLRSSGLKKCDSESRRIPDLNAVMCEFDAVMSRGKSVKVVEDNGNAGVGMEVENEGRKCGSQRAKSCQNDKSRRSVEADDGGGNDEVGKKKLGSGTKIVDKEDDVVQNSDVSGSSGDKMGSVGGARQGRNQVVGKVLRSRVVVAGRTGESPGRKRKKTTNDKGGAEEAVSIKGETDGSVVDSEHTGNHMSLVEYTGPVEEETGPIDDVPVLAGRIEKNSTRKRKKKTMNGKREEEAVSVKGENDDSTVDSEHVENHLSLVEYVGPVEEETSPVDDAIVVSKVEDEDADHNLVDRPKRKRGRPSKYVDSPGKGVEKSLVVVKSEVAKSSSKLVGKLKKGKRGRPRKVVDHPIVDSIQKDSAEVADVEDEDLNNRVVGNQKKMKKGKRGRPRKNFSSPVDGKADDDTGNGGSGPMSKRGCKWRRKQRKNLSSSVDGEADDDAGNVGSESMSKRGRKRRRRRRKIFSPEDVDGESDDDVGNVGGESVLKRGRKRRRKRRKLFTVDSDVDQESDEDLGNVGSETVSKRGRKRQRPKRFTGVHGSEIVEMKKVPFVDLDEEVKDDNNGVNLCNKPVGSPKKKGKRGRPRKQDTEEAKKKPFKKGKLKISRRKGCVRVRRLDNGSHRVPKKEEMLALEVGKSVVSLKSEDTPMCENNTSLKGKKVKTSGAISAEKNMIRTRIADMLLDAGWKVEYRPRQGRDYNDAVYVNPRGKSCWSITSAYFTLKKEVELGKVDNPDFQFSPIPEEVLSKLFRVISKPRSKKKQSFDTGDSSDEESTKGKKRKYTSRDGAPSKRRCALLVRKSHHGSNSGGDGDISHSGKDSILSWVIDSGIVPIEGKVQYMNGHKTKAMLEGSVTKDGIHCSCCKQVISVSEFEDHSGSKLCERYANVLLESGHSLLQCQVDAWNKQEEKGRNGYYSVPVEGEDPNDDTCGICGDGGDLVCCDGCPSTFHHDCLNIEEIPSGEWHCVYCSCKFCGRVDEASSERDDDCDTGASSLAICSLCNRKYHRSCSDEVHAVCVESKQLSFCGHICKQIFERLQSLVGVKHDLDDGFSWILLQRSDIEADTVNLQPEKIIRNSKLAIALAVMDECFLPILDSRSGIDLIRHIVYSCGSNFTRLNFSNFFTVILEKGDELISAASVRIHGKGLAEMPFIGTRNVYRRQGMCRRLLSAIELALGSLEVEKLIIPAVSELVHTWTSVFNFEPLEESVQQEMRSISMLVFPHTGMLQKLVPNQQIVKKTIPVTEEIVKCHESGIEFSDVGVDKSEVDNGSVNGKFDLNCAAPELPESSTDERHLVSSAGNCEDEIKSVINLGEITDANNLQSRSLKNKDDQARGRTFQPDLNVIEENMFGEEEKTKVNLDGVVKSRVNSPVLTKVDRSTLLENGSDLNELPKSELDCDGTNCENHGLPVDKMGPASYVMGCYESEVGCCNNGDSDGHGKKLGYSSGLTKVDGSSLLENGSDLNELPKSELESDGTNCHGVSTLDKMGENHGFLVGKVGPTSSIMGCNESEMGCSSNDNSDVHGEKAANGENGSLTLKFVPETESPKTEELPHETGRQSSDSQMECKSLDPLKSDSVCTIS